MACLGELQSDIYDESENGHLQNPYSQHHTQYLNTKCFPGTIQECVLSQLLFQYCTGGPILLNKTISKAYTE